MTTIDRLAVRNWLACRGGKVALLDRSYESALSDLAYRVFSHHAFYPRIIAGGSPEAFRSYWRRYFELVLDDPHAAVIGYLCEGELLAAVSICDARFPTPSVFVRFLSSFFKDAGLAALLHYVRYVLAFRRAMSWGMNKSRTAQGMWIFKAPGLKGAAVGMELIRLCEDLLHQMGFEFAQLMADQTDPVLCRFYARLGYSSLRQSTVRGAPVQVFLKRLLARDFQVEVHTTLPREWFGSGPFSDPAYLQHVERCGFEGIRFWYLLGREKGAITACAALFSMPVDAASVFTGLVRKLIGLVRTIWPSFLRARVLFWGSPPSLANAVVHLAPGTYPAQTLPRLIREAEGIARREKIGWIALKEYRDADADWARHFELLGYIRCDSPQAYVMPVRWSCFSDYLDALRHSYRRRLNLAERRMQEKGIQVEQYRGVAATFSRSDYQLYLEVLSRARAQFERLPASYFQGLPNVFGERQMLSRFVLGSRTVAWSWSLCEQDRTVNLFVGMDYEVNREHDLYVNILADVVRLAIDSGSRSIHFGQAAAEAKARMGATPEALFYAIRHRNPFIHGVLRLSRRAISLAELLPRFHVFKELQPALATAGDGHACE